MPITARSTTRGLLLAFAFASAAPLASAQAQDGEEPIHLNRRGPEGHDIRLGTWVSWNGQCQRQGTPSVEVTQAPASGKTEIRPGSKVATENLVGGTSCNGMRFDGTSLYYLPNPGFQGNDTVVFEVRFLDRKVLHFTAHVRVRAGQPADTSAD